MGKLSRILFTTGLILTAVILIKANLTYLQRVGAFGCFDDCHTFATAYFMNKGRQIYSEIFYNHQPLISYISLFIQKTFNPQSLYSLVISHRIFVMAFSFLMDILLIVRFRWVGLGFVALYEATKFYFFGDRFLPEAFIPYILAYLLGSVWHLFQGEALSKLNLFLISLFSWLSVFLREPYIPVTLLLYALILVKTPSLRRKLPYLLIFTVLTFLTLAPLSLKDYFETVVLLNIKTSLQGEVQTNNLLGTGAFQIIFYPLFIILKGEQTFLREILILVDAIFIVSITLLATKLRQIKLAIIILIALTLAGIRTVSPGTMFYEAFHLLPWYGLFLMSTLLSLKTTALSRSLKWISKLLILLYLNIVIMAFFSPRSFLQEDIDTQGELNVGYARYQLYGDIIQTLAEPEDTLFVELWDDIVYWQAGLDSAYKYALFTPWNAGFEKYQKARLEMFKNNPPRFYYCSEDFQYQDQELIPVFIKSEYVQLKKNDKPICLYIHKDKRLEINQEKLNKASISLVE